MPTNANFHRTLHNTIRAKINDVDFDAGTIPGHDGSAVVVLYDNDPRTQPDGGLFVRVLLVPGLTRQITMGSSRMFRHFGTIVAEIHQRINTGTAASLDVADTLASAFRGSTVSGITYQSPEVLLLGREDEGQFFRVSVRVPYYSDEQESA
tara:strand:+ start:1583 stop:2035 length:453 start_codon:yes stop_codon:yes gene_type:complete